MAGLGGMKVTDMNGVKVYTVSGQKSFASWLAPDKKRSLRKDAEYLRRIELVQDLQFDTASTRLKATPDGQYLIASGIYPPQVRVYELSELSLKFERHLTSEIVNFQVLGEDYSKLAFLCADRSVVLHAKFGSYYSTRIPRMGRDLAYDRWSCDLLLAASSPEVYRLNLEQGRFLAPLATRSPGINVIGRSPVHGLIACGGEDGALECFDLRQKAPVGRINAVAPTGNSDQEVTSLRFDESEGLLLAAGTSAGQVLLYDLRSSIPLRIKDHMYGSPIVDIKWHESVSNASKHLVTADSHVVRIWDPQTGNGMTSIEAPVGEINDVCVVRKSGLIFMALDSPRIPSFFIPSLGPAPRWCSFLENLTEELEEGGQTTIYDDYKFVTREDLERLNLTNMLGTNLLRAYMHGFFIDHRLYAKAKAVADPFAYEEYRQQRIREKLDAARAARITVKKKLPKVNQELAARLLTAGDADTGYEQTDEAAVKAGKKKKLGANLLKDERFSAMFKDKAFEVDEDTQEFRILHPNMEKRKTSLLSEHFDLVSEGEGESEEDVKGDADTGDSSSDEDERVFSKHSRKQEQLKARKEDRKKGKAAGPRLYEAKDEVHAQAFKNQVSLAKRRNQPLEERLAAFQKPRNQWQQDTEFGEEVRGRGGSRQLSFTPRSSSDRGGGFRGSSRGRGGETGRGGSGDRDFKKRGIQSLGLKNDRSFKGGRGGRGSFRGRGRGRGRS